MTGVAARLMQEQTGVFAERMQERLLYVLGYSVSVFGNSVSVFGNSVSVFGNSVSVFGNSVSVFSNSVSHSARFIGLP